VLADLVSPRWRARPVFRPAPFVQRGNPVGRAPASLWIVGIALSLYGAPELQTWLRTSTWASRHPATVTRITSAVLGASRWTGLLRLHELLEGGSFEGRRPRPTGLAGAAARAGSPPTARRPPNEAAVVNRVLIVGASTIQFHLGVELERALRARSPALAVERLGKLSTGLCRPDVFDWPAKLRALVAAFHPDLIIANFGGNDAQGMVLDDGDVAIYGSARWEASYRTRVREIVAIGRDADARVLMLGMSTTRDPLLNRRMEHINAITAEATRAAGGQFLSIWDLGADASGRFQDVIVIDGAPTRTRLADGKHFSHPGATHVAGKICDRLAERYRFVSAPPQVPPGRGDVSQR
jgi:hypothetical protein